ncbi:hypothetical protein D3C86_2118810 [compost metagenome]
MATDFFNSCVAFALNEFVRFKADIACPAAWTDHFNTEVTGLARGLYKVFGFVCDVADHIHF